jgi:F-type H+-transporting ATPase subunit gamma
MASARDLRKKIKSIANTKKITRTMELVATSKAKRAQDRVNATAPYSAKLLELLRSLTRARSIAHPLLSRSEKTSRAAILAVTGKRGLCGGYNTSVLSLLEKAVAVHRQEGREVEIYVVGRKGTQRLRYLQLEAAASYTHFDDRPSFQDASDIAGTLMDRFTSGAVQQVSVFSTRYLSAGNQRPMETRLLPIDPPAGDDPQAEGKGRGIEFIFEPSPEALLEAILPLSVKSLVYRLLVEAVASEQLARRMAMKRATDNAEDMVKSYTRRYNRTRQASITQQIGEIVGGASALE